MPSPAPEALWPGVPPGRIAPGQEGHARAGEVPHLAPFLLPGEAPRPLIVVCPGGGYGNRAAHEGAPVAAWLNRLGLHAAVLHYRVFPWRHPAPLLDAQRALRLVRARARAWGVDGSRVGILGFSAGGHLACSAANFGDEGDPRGDAVARCSSRADALIACYPVVSFGEHRHHGSMLNLLGPRPEPGLRRLLSLETSVSPRNPPTFLWHTADDAGVPVENSLLYAAALARERVRCALHIYPRGHHGLGLAEGEPGSVALWPEACAGWLREIGFCKA